MSIDPNTARLLDKIELLTRANDAQLETIQKYRRRNCALQRENDAYRAMVSKAGTQATRPQEIEQEGR